jgi:hypothetical protein
MAWNQTRTIIGPGGLLEPSGQVEARVVATDASLIVTDQRAPST